MPKKKKDKPTPTPKDTPPPAHTPEQKMGDTPVAPWEMPTPEQKADAQPVKRALKKAISEVDTPEQADRVAATLVENGQRKTVEEVAQEQKQQKDEPVGEAASAVEQEAHSASPGEKAGRVIEKAASEVEAAQGPEREALAEAVQEVLNPEQQGAPPDVNTRRRQLLRKAILKRMKPLDALDAELFLAVNHLPHSRVSNGFFYLLTLAFNGGGAWFALMALATLLDRKHGWRVTRTSAVPLAIAASAVEYPIKAFFRRRRPFSLIVQAIVIGKKPGSWSFPSGHSAAAFAGAWLLSKHYPRMRWLLNIVAALVAFSRMYLGDHYPGDVASGSLSGIVLAEIASRLLNGRRRAEPPAAAASIAPGRGGLPWNT